VEQEGVIKYQLAFQHRKLPKRFVLPEHFNRCRTRLREAGLLGQDAARYGGLGFGNISFRSQEQPTHFVISGTQTGGIEVLSERQLSCVTDFDACHNCLSAYGETAPSSEAMTHGVLYGLNSAIQAVIHVHSPDIWHRCDVLQLASTSANITYGTPEMSKAVSVLGQRLQTFGLPLLLVMKGHQDGVVAAGESLESCTDALLNLKLRAEHE